jgi:hypothetical protein
LKFTSTSKSLGSNCDLHNSNVKHANTNN